MWIGYACAVTGVAAFSTEDATVMIGVVGGLCIVFATFIVALTEK